MWVKDEKESNEWTLEVQDPDGWYCATVKFNGCIHLNKFYNIPLPRVEDENQLSDYIHYCDIDDEIERLKQLKEEAIKYFGRDWNK